MPSGGAALAREVGPARRSGGAALAREVGPARRSGSAALAREPALADLAPLFLRGAAPDARLLVGGQGELEALALGLAGPAYALGRVDLLQGGAGGADREEEVWIGVSARCQLPPVAGVPVDRAAPGQGHSTPPRHARKDCESIHIRLAALLR